MEFKKPTNRANGLTRDLQGRLVVCEGVGRRVIREEPDGTITVIASTSEGANESWCSPTGARPVRVRPQRAAR